MKDYEGPVYQSDEQKPRRFAHRGSSEGRPSFKPTLQSRRQEIESYEPAYKPPETERFNVQKARDNEVLEAEIGGGELYEVPFVKQQEHRNVSLPNVQKLDKSMEMVVDEDEYVPRSQYEPSFKPTVEAKVQAEQPPVSMSQPTQASQSATTFQPKHMPKPYRAEKMEAVDLHTRELAKRLVKTRDTFLLFEQED